MMIVLPILTTVPDSYISLYKAGRMYFLTAFSWCDTLSASDVNMWRDSGGGDILIVL